MVRHFQVLYYEFETVLYVAKRGRKHVIGLQDGLFLLLDWLHSAGSIDLIARSPTLYNYLDKTGKAIHKVVVDRYIKPQWESPLRTALK
jgi:hypothetical protein